MTALMDMEELLAKISNRGMVGYMREAATCYAAGAYRGCIVLSYIALFDDMRAKLAQLSTINKVAHAVHLEVEKRANDQDVFETFMADRLKKEGFLTAAEHTQLDIVRRIRNRAAHPSGVVAKAEEARYVYRVVIDDFLGQPLLKTTQAVDALVERLDGSNCFPTTDIDDVVAISKQALEGMHPEAYVYLIAKLVELGKGAVEQPKRNAERMLIGLARAEDAALRPLLRSVALVRLSHDGDLARVVGRLIAADAELLAGLKSAIYDPFGIRLNIMAPDGNSERALRMVDLGSQRHALLLRCRIPGTAEMRLYDQDQIELANIDRQIREIMIG